MTALTEKRCVPCSEGAPTATGEEIDRFMSQLPDWDTVEIEGMNRLTRAFKFKNFSDALLFTVQVGKIAEEENHHPAIMTQWGKVTVAWWTHKISGLHANDFIMAAKTDGLVSKPKQE